MDIRDLAVAEKGLYVLTSNALILLPGIRPFIEEQQMEGTRP